MEVDLIIQFTGLDLETKKDAHILKNEAVINYFFKSIETYLTGLNKIFVILPDNYELPKINTAKKVFILYESNIVQNNQTTTFGLEPYYYNIPELSEYYLVINAFTFILKPILAQQFFDAQKDELKIKACPEKPQSIEVERQNFYTQYKFFIADPVDEPFILKHATEIQPYSKKLWKKFYEDINLIGFSYPITKDTYYLWGRTKNNIISITNAFNWMTFPTDSYCSGIFKVDITTNEAREVLRLNPKNTLEKRLHLTADRWILEGLRSKFNR